MRSADPATLAFLNGRPPVMWTADLFTFTLANGQVIRWTSADIPITTNGNTWLNVGPKLTRTAWNVKNTIDIPEMDITLSSTGTDFNNAATAAQVALNPSDTQGGVLSNANTTFTAGGSGSHGLSRAFYARTAGKFYFEWTVTGAGLGSILGAGLCIGAATWTNIQANGINAALMAALSGAVWDLFINGASSIAHTDVIGTFGLAVDLTAQLLWVRPAAATRWNNNAAANPATAVGGVSLPFAGIPLYPFVTTASSPGTQSVTINLGTSGFAGTVPSGFAAGWPFVPQVTGQNIKALMAQGFFDGAIVELDRVFGLPVPGNGTPPAVIGLPVTLFTGRVGALEIGAIETKMKVKGASVLLQQYMPKNRYMLGCIHSFCDAGCTLQLATFTGTNVVGAGPNTTTSITTAADWILPSSAAMTAASLIGGTFTIVSGNAQGQSRTVIAATTGPSGGTITLSYPLYQLPANGDAITCTQGCDKTLATCTNTYANQQHYRGFDQTPQVEQAL
jgi:hypothetical protein